MKRDGQPIAPARESRWKMRRRESALCLMGDFSCCALGWRHSHFQIQLPLPVKEARVSVLPRWMPQRNTLPFGTGWLTRLVCWRRAGCGWGSPAQPVPTDEYTERMYPASTDYWAEHTAEMKTSVHDLNCLKQTSKQTIQPLVTLESRVQPWKTWTLANKGGHCMLWSPSCLCSW